MHEEQCGRWSVDRLARALTVASLVTMAGCSQPATALAGVVTLEGKPIERAFVNLTPERRDAPSVSTVTDKNGRYSVRVSAAVPFRVTIVAQRVVGQQKNDTSPDGPLVNVYEDIVPARYGNVAKTPLTAQPVENAVTTVDFPLTEDASK